MCPAKELKVSSSIAPFSPQRVSCLLGYTQLPGERMRRAKSKEQEDDDDAAGDGGEGREREKSEKEREKDAKESAS